MSFPRSCKVVISILNTSVLSLFMIPSSQSLSFPKSVKPDHPLKLPVTQSIPFPTFKNPYGCVKLLVSHVCEHNSEDNFCYYLYDFLKDFFFSSKINLNMRKKFFHLFIFFWYHIVGSIAQSVSAAAICRVSISGVSMGRIWGTAGVLGSIPTGATYV